MGKKITITRTVDVTEMGRLGGHARAENLSADELSAAGAKAVNVRWAAYYKRYPEKLKAKRARDRRKK